MNLFGLQFTPISLSPLAMHTNTLKRQLLGNVDGIGRY